ncbi:TIGR04222 domain-containing membrane protein [Micromonospora narathiwatensis]|uniref:TIGR04222 domain-containing protein n=1 Tax=Micromonospora narathiwatensis TaxID=299146 RepID=A0A1A8ZU04_9ACTN|nr:TIGR04222 domain-containing membrane protein [Micromonospora narathiwatensis]SBT47605.1 TIGR04222 domain-containing protein [Micromonospora narathiwatensis]
MTVLAAPDDTWGIPGPVFLRWYLVVAAVLVVGTLVHRFRALAGTPVAGAGQLGPQQVAYLNGGDELAVWTALGGLRHAGVVAVRPDRRLTTAGALPAGATPLDQAVVNAAARGVRSGELRRDEWVVRALDQLRDELQRRGLALGPDQRSALRRGPLLIAALLVLGGIRAVVGLSNGRPAGFLLLSLIPLVVAFALLVRVPWRTRAADRALRDLQREHTWLRPSAAPAYATYGPSTTAMGVALFGTATIWAMDPGFAGQAAIQRQALATGGGTSGGSCGSGGTGSSCGGSSCGGGGGCGGGGCGG